MSDPVARRRVGAVVRGIVQGVGFRRFVERTGSGLGLDGWVMNRADGSVELDAEGPPDAIDALIAALHEGPPAAWVEMRNLPPVMSATRLARCSQPPNNVSRLFGQLAVMRQRISPDWAIAGAASVLLAAAATPTPAVLMNLRRFMKSPPVHY